MVIKRAPDPIFINIGFVLAEKLMVIKRSEIPNATSGGFVLAEKLMVIKPQTHDNIYLNL